MIKNENNPKEPAIISILEEYKISMEQDLQDYETGELQASEEWKASVCNMLRSFDEVLTFMEKNICLKCNGEGLIHDENPRYIDGTSLRYPSDYPCPLCNGTGIQKFKKRVQSIYL